jgi:hypothetical protein
VSGTVVAITIKVSDEDANRKLQNMQRQLDRLKGSSTGGGGNPFAGLTAGARGAHSATIELTSSSRSLREAIHAVHPALEQLGLGFGNFAGLGASARAGIGIFAAALLGTLVVALEKAADAAAQAKKSLADLGATPTQVQSLQKLAQQTGVPLATIAEGQRRLQQGKGGELDLPLPDYFPQGPGSGRATPPAGTDEFNKRLIELTRLGAGGSAGGAADYDKITRALQEHGGLKIDDLKGLSEGTSKRLADALGIKIQPTTDKQPIPASQQLQNYIRQQGALGVFPTSSSALERGLGKAGPGIDRDFEKLAPDLDSAVGKVKEALTNLAAGIGNVGLTTALSKLANAVNAAASAMSASNFKTGLHAIAHPLETAIILAGKAKTQQEAEAKARYIATGEGAPPASSAAPAGPAPIAPGPDYIRLTLRRKQWQQDHPGEPLPEGYAGGGLIGFLPGLANGGSIEDLILQLARKRIGLQGRAQNVGLGPILDLMKLTSPFLRGAGMAGGGLLDGPGTETSDSILIRASKGEGILNARAVRAIGKGGLDWLNSLNGYADGGFIDALGGSSSGPGLPPSSGGGSANELHLHLNPDRPAVVVPTDSAATLEAVRSEAAMASLVQIVPRQSFVR